MQDLLPGWETSCRFETDISPDFNSRIWADHTDLSIERTPLGGFRVLFAGLASFDVRLDERRLTINCRRGLPDSTTSHYLADQVVPRIYGQQGSFVLHSAGVVIDNSLVLLLGKSGQGKSTLTGYFGSADHDLIGDDAVILNSRKNRILGEAVYPSLRMFPDSHETISRGWIASPTAHYTTKVRVDSPRLVRGQYPVSVIFRLGLNSRTVRAREMPPAEAAMSLLAETFVLDPTQVDLAESRLRIAARIAASLPVFDLGYPRDYASLSKVAETISNLAR